MKRASTRATILALLLLLAAPAAARGQTERGAITGIVTDTNGAVVPGAAVTVTNLATNVSQTYTTNSEGLYEAPFLSPGSYKVSATAGGFGTTTTEQVVVNVGSRARADLTLRAAGVSSTVDITASTPLVQTESATVGQVVNTRQLIELPNGGRNIYKFLQLNSTVVSGLPGNADRFRVESQGSTAISGTRPSSATFKIDGQANTDPTFGTPTITPSLDSVQEFQLQNNAYSAEFEGITQVNVATKSGTSQVHGSLFEFLMNDYFQPRNPIAPRDSRGRPGKNPLKFNQFGGTIGGPVVLPWLYNGKDRTFFFASYEGRRQTQFGLGAIRVLTAAERAGDFSALLGGCVTVGGTAVPLLRADGTPGADCVRVGQVFDPATTVRNPRFDPTRPQSAFNPEFIRQPFAGNQIPAGRISAIARSLIDVQQPLPNFSSGGDANFTGRGGAILDNDQFSGRIDHRFSERDSIYGRMTVQDNHLGRPSILRFQGFETQGKGRVFNSAWTHVFTPTLVNEFRLGFVRGIYGDTIEEIDPTSFGINNTPLNTLPIILLQPATGGSLTFGGFSGSILATVQNTYQLANNVSWVLRRHGLKFGFKGDHNRFQNGDLFNSNGRGIFTGLFSAGNSSIVSAANRNNAIADFLLGQVQGHSLNITRNANLRNTPWALYVQDDWKVTSRLALNLGLRYEYHQPFAEKQRGGSLVDFSVPGGRILVADPEVAAASGNTEIVACCTGRRVVPTDTNDFGPRIGVAFSPFAGDSMVVRAGYGIFYSDQSQFFHWQRYVPARGASFQPAAASFQTPATQLGDLFPTNLFTPPTGAFFVGTPSGVNPAALGNRPVATGGGLAFYDTPVSQQWSLSIQREVRRDMLVDISYTGSVSSHLPAQWFFNQPTPSATPANFQSLNPAANPYLRRRFANFAIGSSAVANILHSSYNAMTVKVDKRFSRGYNVLSTYTWSKSIDEGSEIFTLGSNFAFLTDNINLRVNRGVSAFDVPHRWVSSGILELPFGKGKRFLNGLGWADRIISGFQVSGVFTLQSGLPFTLYVRNRLANDGLTLPELGDRAGDPYFSKQEWKNLVKQWETTVVRLFVINPNSVNINYAPGTFGNLPRNFFRAPHGRALDFSVAKNTRLTEGSRLQLRVDIFNVTNERLHRLDVVNNVFGPGNLTHPLRGTIPERVFLFNPRVIQLGLRLDF